jgi:hypothetical protein
VRGPKGHLGVPKVVLSFSLDHSGIAGIKSAEAQLQEMVEVPVPTPKPKSSFKIPTKAANASANATEEASASASPSVDPTAADVTPEPTPAAEAAEVPAVNSTEADANSTIPEKPKTVMKKFLRRFPLTVTVDYSELAVRPMSTQEKAAALKT